MIHSLPLDHAERVQKIAHQYAERGYQVKIEPARDDLPFDLGNYRPDLVAQKEGETLVVEVKTQSRNLSVDRYREIAQEVARHKGWRFLLVTAGDVQTEESGGSADDLLGREMVVSRAARARELLAQGDAESSYLIAWSALEGLLRLRAKQASIPVERLPIVALARHLYSQGELSANELDDTLGTIHTRNRIAHGFQAPTAPEDAEKLQGLISQLLLAAQTADNAS